VFHVLQLLRSDVFFSEPQKSANKKKFGNFIIKALSCYAKSFFPLVAAVARDLLTGGFSVTFFLI
jgi:hypothetical protein